MRSYPPCAQTRRYRRVLRHERSRGVSAARNADLQTVSTPYVAFVDDDDLWAPDKLAAQLAAVEADGDARWSCGGSVHVRTRYRVTGSQDPPPSGDVSALLTRFNVVPGGGSGVLVETALARELGGFDEELSILADWDFNLRLSRSSPVAAVARPLVAYYLHRDSMFHDPRGVMRELFQLDRKYADRDVFCFGPAQWFVDCIRMALQLRAWRTAVHLARRGAAETGSFEMLRWSGHRLLHQVANAGRRLLRPRRYVSPGWLDRYRSASATAGRLEGGRERLRLLAAG